MTHRSFALGLLFWLLLPPPGQAGTLAQFRTVFGSLEVELYDQQKPITVGNFKRLVQSGAYQNTFFHRLVPGFVAQGGGYYTAAPGSADYFAYPWTWLRRVPNFGAISNEFNAGPLLSNTNGTIAMAKLGGNPDSATCEWFFSLGNNSTNLDNQNGGFTVFGRVIRDTGPPQYGGLLGLFNLLAYDQGIVNEQWWHGTNDLTANVFTTLPVTYFGYYAPPPCYSELLYVDISLLDLQVTAQSGGSREISWNSVSNKLHYVEFTTNFPPVWTTLASTNGTGGRMAVADSAARPRRFYRVRVAY